MAGTEAHPGVALVVSDVDGTLLDPDKNLSPGAPAAVRRLKRAGIRFTIASARPPRLTYPLLRDLHVSEPSACFNGALLIDPAASAPSFQLFLAALIILAAGITALQVSANPYVALLGPARTASSRLTLTQAFNSFGTFIAPVFGGILILATTPKTAAEIAAMNPAVLHAYRVEQASSVKLPYIMIMIALVLLAVVIGKFNL